MVFRPETAKPLNELAEVLLRGPSALSRGERELIAAYVSSRNDCFFCHRVHGAVAACHLDGDEELVAAVKDDFQSSAVSPKLKALLAIAGNVQRGGKNVWQSDIQLARERGATDLEIHDTVLIAAAFCMYNRATSMDWPPGRHKIRRHTVSRGRGLRKHGYETSTDGLTSKTASLATFVASNPNGSRYV